MAIVAASTSTRYGHAFDTSFRPNKKKKIRISPPDYSGSNIWVFNSVVHEATGMDDIAKRQWEKEIRRISLSALPSMRSMEYKISRSEGCLACTTNKVHTRGKPSLRKAVLSKQAHSADGYQSPPQSPEACQKPHSHSDLCIRHCPRRKHSKEEDHSDDESQQTIEIVSSHSSLKCGTNIKAWTLKVNIRPFTPQGEVCVSAEGQFVKIKAKYGPKRKGIERIFGSGQKEVKRTLKFAGEIETSSLRTVTDKEGFLTIDLMETLPY